MNTDFKRLTQDYMQLAWEFCVNPESCENPKHYESYLQLDALSDANSGRGTTHLLLEVDDTNKPKAIMGFMTLRATSLTKEDERGEICGSAALEITELSVDEKYERNGVGSKLIGLATLLAEEVNRDHMGIEYIVLCADHRAVDFYRKTNPSFVRLADYYTVPREGWNENCIPMGIRLPEK